MIKRRWIEIINILYIYDVHDTVGLCEKDLILYKLVGSFNTRNGKINSIVY